MAAVLRDIISHITHPTTAQHTNTDQSTTSANHEVTHTNTSANIRDVRGATTSSLAAEQLATHPGGATVTETSTRSEHPEASLYADTYAFAQAQETAGQQLNGGYMPHIEGAPSGSPSAIPRSAYSSNDLTRYDGQTIKLRDLAHIETLALEGLVYQNAAVPGGQARAPVKYDISGMPIGDVIEMVAGLLTKITTTNDRQHEHLHRPLPPIESTQNATGLTASVLAFHGKNVPSISVLSYLSRIHKYCPLTYEVFLSLLVYFDRMTERVNPASLSEMAQRAGSDRGGSVASGRVAEHEDEPPRTPISLSVSSSMEDVNRQEGRGLHKEEKSSPQLPDLHNCFVVDSFNIHRLVIAGVTCASKYFSDTFYTNSRYAKVGGLPLPELNHLELQFLLLNDFRLAVPVEELEAYGTMLVEFYIRDVLAKRDNDTVMQEDSPDTWR